MASLRSLVWIDGEHRPTALIRILVIWIGSWVAGFAAFGISGLLEQGGVPEPVLVGVRPLLGYGLPIAAIALGIVFIDRRTVSDWGMTLDRDWWADFGFGLALAAGLLLAIFAIMAAADWIRITGTVVTTDDPPVTGFLANTVRIVVLFVGVGIFEEVFSRGSCWPPSPMVSMASGQSISVVPWRWPLDSLPGYSALSTPIIRTPRS